MKNVFENIKAAEITDNEIEKIAGGAIVYDGGTYDLYSGDTLIGSYWDYEDAYNDALWYGIGTAYFSSLSNYRNRNRKTTRKTTRRTTRTTRRRVQAFDMYDNGPCFETVADYDYEVHNMY